MTEPGSLNEDGAPLGASVVHGELPGAENSASPDGDTDGAREGNGRKPKFDVIADYEKRVANAAARVPSADFDIEALVHHREKMYGTFSSWFGWFVYGLSCLLLVGLVIAPFAMLGGFIAQGIYFGAPKSKGIRVSEEQFPEVHYYVEKLCTLMRMPVPQVFIVQEHGLLNAFVNRLHRKDILVICSDVIELAYKHGERELAFVVAHELTHVKRGHVRWAWLHIPAGTIPFFGDAYSRACEYTCDRVASYLVPDGALYGLVALAAGTKLYRRVNLQALYDQQEEDWGFWTWYHEITSTHPNLINRIRAIGIADEVAARSLKPKGKDAPT
jgi:Zn-dependent protease with chaperone function